MAVVGVADQYMILMTIALLFTVLALAYSKSILLSLLAAISWVVSAVGHFAIGDKTSALTSSLAFLFLAFAIIFVVSTINKVTRTLNQKPDDSWWKE